MAPPPLLATVVYLTTTGHVLAAVTSGSLETTVEDLTGGDHLRVRVPNYVEYVNVPASVLSAARVEATRDLLDRPQWYAYGDGAAPLTLGSEPQLAVTLPTTISAAANKKFVLVWQTADKAIAEDSVADASGNLPTASASRPPGATAGLLAYEGGPLYVNAV